MYGLVFEIVEEWVIEVQGPEIWHAIKEKAGCKVGDYEFLRRSFYEDKELVDIVVAASEILSLEIPAILEAFGHFVIRHHYANGYDELLKCQGPTLRQWLSNLNAMHDHIQQTFEGDKFVNPIFWCEDCGTVEGSILLHYYSMRGTMLVPMVVGIVEELASFEFGVEVKMTQLALQDENGSQYTTWRITAVDETKKWKLSPRTEDECGLTVNFDNVKIPNQCPYSGKILTRRKSEKAVESTAKSCPFSTSSEKAVAPTAKSCPFSSSSISSTSTSSLTSTSNSSSCEPVEQSLPSHISHSQEEMGLSLERMQVVFPFHVLVDRDFTILQLGKTLPALLHKPKNEIIGKRISEILDITRPVLGSTWEWKSLLKLSDQHFFLVPKSSGSLKKRVSMKEDLVKFKASMIEISNNKVMFALSPDARNVKDLNDMNLTLSDLPLISCQRDTVFLGEYITQEMNKAHQLDKLSKKLNNEKKLSNTLLYNMLPKSVADTLRSGGKVEPTHHENVTLFFSDIVGFTSLCNKVEPCDVIVLLNQLYTVMDHLASHFGLYKVETIGDAYMCCSGLPEPDEYHAENIANFAIAVMHCVQQVKNPLNGNPIKLRIGIHTGSCTSGVVGTLTPHYCLFGDMVNTTARHESTGEAGKIQCSSVLFGRLKHFSTFEKEQYRFTPRGLVHMKGKGDCCTYWLEGGTEDNARADAGEIEALSEQVRHLLARKSWKVRRYFKHGGELREDATETMSVATSISSTSECSLKGLNKIQLSHRSLSVELNHEDSERQSGLFSCSERQSGLFSCADSMTGVGSTFDELVDHEKAIEDLDRLIDEKERVSDKESLCNRADNDLRSLSTSTTSPVVDEDDDFHSEEDTLLVEGDWSELSIEKGLTRKRLISEVSTLLFSVLGLCITDPEVTDELRGELYGFVQRVSTLYSSQNGFHSFRRACNVVFRVCYLAERAEGLASDRWHQFILAFAALVQDINNSELSSERHRDSKKEAIQFGLEILQDEFPDLSDEVNFGCPRFMNLVRKAALATKSSNIEKTIEKFERVMSNTNKSARQKFQRKEATLELIMVLANIGHYSQEYELFLRWNKLEFEEHFIGEDSGCCDRWFDYQRKFFSQIVIPLTVQSEKVIPVSIGVKEGVEKNLREWKKEGCTRALRLKEGTKQAFQYYYFE